MKLINKLTDFVVRNAKVEAKPVKLFDGKGLYLEISPSGGKSWRLKYSYGGKEKRLSIGKYPYISLKEARELRDKAKKMLSSGKDPSETKRAEKAAMAAASVTRVLQAKAESLDRTAELIDKALGLLNEASSLIRQAAILARQDSTGRAE